MPARDNENRIKDSREQWLDDLLAADREQVQKAAEQQIAGGMYRRIVQAHAERGHRPTALWQWAMASAGVALMILVVWIALPRKKTETSTTAMVFRSTPGPSRGSVEAPVANSRQPIMPRRTPGPTRVKVSRQPSRNVVPKQTVFPANVVATEEERLLMELARNHPEKLEEIARLITDDNKQEKERARAFEEWLRQGEKQ